MVGPGRLSVKHAGSAKPPNSIYGLFPPITGIIRPLSKRLRGRLMSLSIMAIRTVFCVILCVGAPVLTACKGEATSNQAPQPPDVVVVEVIRSEERRVGKEGRS